MKIYNTMSAKKEEFTPVEEGKVSIYVCGPTVFNFYHVGNARPVVVFDVLRRYLEYRGYEVNYVTNFTDVDDKIIKRAKEEKCSSEEIAERFIAEYWVDTLGLGVKEASAHPKATENIDGMIRIISTLIEKGLAYQSGQDVYFRTEAFPEYGKLSRQPLEDLLAGARIETGDIKENPTDFVLWKGAKQGEPYWDSPWSKGRPGWHIECSAMADRYIGKTIDIHCGGQDLVFPHHENEIAQSEGYSGRKLANYWMHNAFLSIDNAKMSKSLGNFFTVRDTAEIYGYASIRMFLLMAHYRSPLSFSADALSSAKSALARLQTCHDNLTFLAANGTEALNNDEREFLETSHKYRERFIAAMDDDLNTADAVSVIFELVRACNTIAASQNCSKEFAARSLELLRELEGVLGLLYEVENADGSNESDGIGDDEVESLINARNAARAVKDWAEADRIRDELGKAGIILEDTAQGVKWKRA